jgi:hypothetical protein
MAAETGPPPKTASAGHHGVGVFEKCEPVSTQGTIQLVRDDWGQRETRRAIGDKSCLHGVYYTVLVVVHIRATRVHAGQSLLIDVSCGSANNTMAVWLAQMLISIPGGALESAQPRSHRVQIVADVGIHCQGRVQLGCEQQQGFLSLLFGLFVQWPPVVVLKWVRWPRVPWRARLRFIV